MPKKRKTPEEIAWEMEEGEKEADVYSEEGREKLIEDSEIEDWEEGFMEGAEDRGRQNSCAECGELLGEDEAEIFEREFNGELKWFCCEEHAEKYAAKREKKVAQRKKVKRKGVKRKSQRKIRRTKRR